MALTVSPLAVIRAPVPTDSTLEEMIGAAVAVLTEIPSPPSVPTATPIEVALASGFAAASIWMLDAGVAVPLSRPPRRMLVVPALAVTVGDDVADASAPDPLTMPPARPVLETVAAVFARAVTAIVGLLTVPSTRADTLPLAMAVPVDVPIATRPPAAP